MDPAVLASILSDDTDSTDPGPNLLSGASTQPAIGLDAFVTTKIKEKIWSNQYVEFPTLLPTYKEDHTFHFKDKDGSLCLAASKPSKFITLNDWITAFATYMSIYVQKWPAESQALLKYMQIIRNIAARGGDFRKYDETFRRVRQSQLMAWDSLHAELYVQVMMSGSFQPRHPQPFRGSGASPKEPRTPKGFCIKFHKGEHCPGCRYKHTCFNCGEPHQRRNCPSATKVASYPNRAKNVPAKAAHTDKN